MPRQEKNTAHWVLHNFLLDNKTNQRPDTINTALFQIHLERKSKDTTRRKLDTVLWLFLLSHLPLWSADLQAIDRQHSSER